MAALKYCEKIRLVYIRLEKKRRYLAIISVLAIFFESLYFVCSMIPWSKMGVAEWAYWVGATGSIAAIFGAYFIGERQARHARNVALDLHQAALNNRRDAILDICQICIGRMKIVERVFLIGTYKRSAFDFEMIETLKILLADIQPVELGNYKAIFRFLNLNSDLDKLNTLIKNFDDALSAHNTRVSNSYAKSNPTKFPLTENQVNSSQLKIQSQINHIKRVLITVGTSAKRNNRIRLQ